MPIVVTYINHNTKIRIFVHYNIHFNLYLGFLYIIVYIVGQVSYALTPLVFQTNASTKLASPPIISTCRRYRTHFRLVWSQPRSALALTRILALPGNFEIPTYRLTADCSASELQENVCGYKGTRTLHLPPFGGCFLPHISFIPIIAESIVLETKGFYPSHPLAGESTALVVYSLFLQRIEEPTPVVLPTPGFQDQFVSMTVSSSWWCRRDSNPHRINDKVTAC